MDLTIIFVIFSLLVARGLNTDDPRVVKMLLLLRFRDVHHQCKDAY